ncbi:alcohol dehydrogenase [Ochrobactrum sp. 30A/1000/2015]|nr:alcohol dehydrogenase [Ochrobactrum sp. 30A/1000/2015]PJT36898.1 alcohol dehydrogenase [Ochrobactrum sp. 27A/999/2015]PJT41798.1 alcohol dehydrogenase [Ochrobactrum sp. 23A/997/2015]
MKLIWKAAVGGAGALAAAWLFALSTPYWLTARQESAVDVTDKALIEKGEYVAHAGDCAACHTAPGGKAFAGGLGMQTPLGTIYSTNITPDCKTGIGSYSYADFKRAVRQGVRRDNVHLYPAMPFVSYTVVNDEDMKALYAFFMSKVEPVQQDNQPSTLPWPTNMRWPLAYWQLFFGNSRPFEIAADTDPVVARGAYLVEGLGHCGACHTPRGLAYEEKAVKNDPKGRFLSGSVLEGWYAKNLRDQDTGLSTWAEDEIVTFLKTGRTDRTAAFGSMADVVQHSTQHLAEDDLRAIARYLKSLAPSEGRAREWQPKEDVTTAALKAGDFTAPGALSYVEQCSVCHRMDGKGAPRIYPALAGNSIVFADDPSSLIQVTLTGGRTPDTPADRMAFTMPGFADLPNWQVAEILNFIRNGWRNHGAAITEQDIARMRREIAHKPVHYVPENKQ